MRTSINLSERQIEALDAMAVRGGISRAAVIQQAINAWLASRPQTQAADAFGLWGCGEDGVAYQDRMRGELY